MKVYFILVSSVLLQAAQQPAGRDSGERTLAPPLQIPRRSSVASKPAPAETLFRLCCVRCHGTDGTGNRSLVTMPEIPNFTSAAWQARRKNEGLVASVLDGKGTSMPPFRDKISTEQARHLVAYIRSFDARRKNGAEDRSSDFEQRFRRLREEWQELRSQFREVSASISLP